MDIPDRRYFKIGEVSKLTETASHIIRYWESEFPQISPKRANSKQRLYRREDVQTILYIRELLHGRGYTIAGAKKVLAENQNPEPLQDHSAKAERSDMNSRLVSLKSGLLEVAEILEKKRIQTEE